MPINPLPLPGSPDCPGTLWSARAGLVLPQLHVGRIPAQTGSTTSMLGGWGGGIPALPDGMMSKDTDPKEKAVQK